MNTKRILMMNSDALGFLSITGPEYTIIFSNIMHEIYMTSVINRVKNKSKEEILAYMNHYWSINKCENML